MDCNRDCFNCPYDDCKVDGFSTEEVKNQDQFDYDLKPHSTEQHKKDSVLYYRRHIEKCRQKNRDYYQTHKEKFKEYDRLRKIEHPVSKEKQHEYYIRWRDKKRGENRCTQN